MEAPMSRIRRAIAVTLGLSFLGLCPLVSSAAEKAALAYTPTLYSAHVVIAREKGLFAKHGVEMDPKLFTAGRLTLDAVLAKGADFATTAETPMTAAVMTNQPIAVLARLAKAMPTTLAHADAKIESMADLRGKKIGITAGTGSEVYTFTMLAKAGMKPSDVQYVNLRPEDMPGALMNRSVDAINTWQPNISNAQKLLGAKAKVVPTAGIYNETWNLVVTQDYLKAKPQVATAMLKALLEAEAFIQANRGESMDILSRVVGVERGVVEASWPNFEFRIAIDPAVVEILEAHSRWRIATSNAPGGATAVPDFRKVIFSAPLKAASAERVSPGY
jgi:ABC-type nitrate/sulfonate/bicarbonate transport system substrate-binding protein